MEIAERTEDDAVVLTPSGKILAGDGGQRLRDRVEALLEAGRRQIVFDLAAVSYVDSAGLGQLVRCQVAVSRREGRLRLRNLDDRVRQLLAITRLLPIFEAREP